VRFAAREGIGATRQRSSGLRTLAGRLERLSREAAAEVLVMLELTLEALERQASLALDASKP
jgi:hypothetical protein